MKSLLQLLREEDRAIKNYESCKEDCEYFSEIHAPRNISLECEKRANNAKGEINSVRKEICEYFKLIGIMEESAGNEKREN